MLSFLRQPSPPGIAASNRWSSGSVARLYSKGASVHPCRTPRCILTGGTMYEKRFDDPNQAKFYASFRPKYPAALFERFAALTQHHERAWDVGTGNGQAASAVAKHFQKVVATDISEIQLSLADQIPNVIYHKMSATPSADELERCVGPEGSVDLVTVAAALHWFDLAKFYPIVKHVLRKPGGLIAAWTYAQPQVTPEVDDVGKKVMAKAQPYRAPVSRYFLEEYQTIPFPFEPVGDAPRGGKIQPEKLTMTKAMDFDGYLSLLRSFSAVRLALQDGIDVFSEDIMKAFQESWGPREKVHDAKFPTFLLLGTVSHKSTS